MQCAHSTFSSAFLARVLLFLRITLGRVWNSEFPWKNVNGFHEGFQKISPLLLIRTTQRLQNNSWIIYIYFLNDRIRVIIKVSRYSFELLSIYQQNIVLGPNRERTRIFFFKSARIRSMHVDKCVRVSFALVVRSTRGENWNTHHGWTSQWRRTAALLLVIEFIKTKIKHRYYFGKHRDADWPPRAISSFFSWGPKKYQVENIFPTKRLWVFN